MIFGKIDPVLYKAVQDNPFNPTPEYITASYVTAFADRYFMGSNQVNFRVLYGNCTFEDGEITLFNTIQYANVTLSGSAIETWGTDDAVILDDIANQQGTSVIQIITSSYNGTFL